MPRLTIYGQEANVARGGAAGQQGGLVRRDIPDPADVRVPAGSPVGEAIAQAGQTLGRVGDALYQAKERREITRMSAALYTTQAQMAEELKQKFVDAELNDDTVGSTFLTETLTPALDGIGRGLETPGARRAYDVQRAQMAAHFQTIANEHQVNHNQNAVKANAYQATNALAQTVAQSPENLETAITQAAAQRASYGTFLSAAQEEAMKADQEATLATTAMRSLIDNNRPGQALLYLTGEKGGQYLPVEMRLQLTERARDKMRENAAKQQGAMIREFNATVEQMTNFGTQSRTFTNADIVTMAGGDENAIARFQDAWTKAVAARDAVNGSQFTSLDVDAEKVEKFREQAANAKTPAAFIVANAQYEAWSKRIQTKKQELGDGATEYVLKHDPAATNAQMAFAANPTPETFGAYADTLKAASERLGRSIPLLSEGMAAGYAATFTEARRTGQPEKVSQELINLTAISGKHAPEIFADLMEKKAITGYEYVAAMSGNVNLGARVVQYGMMQKDDLTKGAGGDAIRRGAENVSTQALRHLKPILVEENNLELYQALHDTMVLVTLGDQMTGRPAPSPEKLAQQMGLGKYHIKPGDTLRIPKTAGSDITIRAGLEDFIDHDLPPPAKLYKGNGEPLSQYERDSLQMYGRWSTNENETGAHLKDDKGHPVFVEAPPGWTGPKPVEGPGGTRLVRLTVFWEQAQRQRLRPLGARKATSEAWTYDIDPQMPGR